MCVGKAHSNYVSNTIFFLVEEVGYLELNCFYEKSFFYSTDTVVYVFSAS